MLKGYWISLYYKIDNQKNLQEYADYVTPIIKKFGGVPLVRGGKNMKFSGSDFLRIVIWEFPSFEKAIECHKSKDYQEGWALAKSTTNRHFQIVEGFNIE
jgi:uncharacterized protein (DUF1330 family)